MKTHAGLAGWKHFRAGRALESIRLDTLKSGACLLLRQWISFASEEGLVPHLCFTSAHTRQRTPPAAWKPLWLEAGGSDLLCSCPGLRLSVCTSHLESLRSLHLGKVSGLTSGKCRCHLLAEVFWVPPGGANCSASEVPQQAPSSLGALAGHPPDIQMPDPLHSSGLISKAPSPERPLLSCSLRLPLPDPAQSQTL